MEHHHRFRRFLEQIRLSPAQVHELRRGHLELSGRLRQDPALRPHFVTTFLQGSYRRSTALRPLAGQDGSDVDLVLVTSLDPRKDEPEVALRLLRPFLQQHYPRVRVQDRSFRITLDGVTLDLVLAAAPSRAALERLRGEARAEPLEDCFEPTDAELEAWKDEPLWIPDRAAQAWRRTHPLAQVASTRTKNARCNQHYVNVVKALKCWRLHAPGMPEHPKSYPLERIVEECCPDEITSVEEGVVLTLEAIGRRFKSGRKPRLRAHGVRGTDVLERVPEADFAAFLRCVGEAVVAARAAFECEEPSESVAGWARLLGPEFPVEVSEAPRGRGKIVRVESAGPARSTEELVAFIMERGRLVVSGLEEVQRLKRALDKAVQQLGIRVEWDPSSPAELRDYVGVVALDALRGGIVGSAVGWMIGALTDDPRGLARLGGLLGGFVGAARGVSRVEAGWRLRSWYDQNQVVHVEVRVLPEKVRSSA